MRTAALAILALLFAVIAVACDSGVDHSAPPITASVLVEVSDGDARWFRDVEVPKGTDGYEFLEAAVEGDLVADWYPEFRAHFVSEIDGVAAEGSAFWGFFLWSESTSAWEPATIGADLLSVKQNHIMAWALVEYDPDTPQIPTSQP
jgi:hypothetical protein